MNNLRSIRIFLTTLFLAASTALVWVGLNGSPMLRLVPETQIYTLHLAAAIGVTLFWLIVTFFFGRVYCSSVCPVGALQDLVIGLRRHLPGHKPLFRYKKPLKIRWLFLVLWLFSIAAGVSVVKLVIEPWPMFANMGAITDPQCAETLWKGTGISSAAGILTAGIVSFVAIVIAAALFGRDYCNIVCPVGQGLAAVATKARFQIKIDPDACTNCFRCEQVCKASCIRVADRLVDNTRCVRCFDCLAVCKDDAIKFNSENFRAASPMMKSVTD